MRPILVSGVLAWVLFMSGCGDNGSFIPPGFPTGVLEGLVIDIDGQPVPDAFINFGYTVLIAGDTVSTPAAPFDIGDPDSVKIEIYDHLGREILSSLPDPHWDGTDSAGNVVDDGPYLIVFRIYEGVVERRIERWFVVVREDPAVKSTVAKVRTDAHGRFRLPFFELPIWQDYPTEQGAITFGHDVVIYAFRGDGSTTFARDVLELNEDLSSISVTLVLPD